MNLRRRFRSIRSRFVYAAGLVLSAVLVVTASTSRAQINDSAPSPLFADEAPLSLTIAMDLNTVLKDRAEERDYHPAILYESGNGAEVAHTIGIKPRGYYRLHFLDCDVPPLRLNFKKKEVAGTVFDGQDKLKLVTHCRNGSERFQQHVFQEYLTYRTYNLLTDASFQARLVHLTYVDSKGRRKPITGYGFLIEDDDRMAERNGAGIIEREVKIHPDATHRETMSLLAVFQYMIGNTDWIVSTRHNIRLMFVHETRTIVAVPYDFDWSGLISTPYATPFAELNLRSVRERKFMGPCRSEAEFAATFQRFIEVEEKIMALFSDFKYLQGRYVRSSIDYLKEFFETIRHSRRIRRDFIKACM